MISRLVSLHIGGPVAWAVCLAIAALMLLMVPRRWFGAWTFAACVLVQLGIFGLVRCSVHPTVSPTVAPGPQGVVAVFFPQAHFSAGVDGGGVGGSALAAIGPGAPPPPPPPTDVPEVLLPSSSTAAIADGPRVVVDVAGPSRGIEPPTIDLGFPPAAAPTALAETFTIDPSPGLGSPGAGPPVVEPAMIHVAGNVFFPTISPADRVQVFVIDRSGSMAGANRLKRVMVEVHKILEKLPQECEFQVIFYDDKVIWLGDPQTLRLLTLSKEAMEQAAHDLAGVSPGGGTDPLPALKKALELGADVVYFLSDGEFELSEQEENELLATNKQGTKIHGTLVGESDAPPDTNSVSRIAAKHNGGFNYYKDSQP